MADRMPRDALILANGLLEEPDTHEATRAWVTQMVDA